MPPAVLLAMPPPAPRPSGSRLRCSGRDLIAASCQQRRRAGRAPLRSGCEVLSGAAARRVRVLLQIGIRWLSSQHKTTTHSYFISQLRPRMRGRAPLPGAPEGEPFLPSGSSAAHPVSCCAADGDGWGGHGKQSLSNWPRLRKARCCSALLRQNHWPAGPGRTGARARLALRPRAVDHVRHRHAAEGASPRSFLQAREPARARLVLADADVAAGRKHHRSGRAQTENASGSAALRRGGRAAGGGGRGGRRSGFARPGNCRGSRR